MQGEKEFNSQPYLRLPLWGGDATSPPTQIRLFWGPGHYEILSAISGAEEQQEKPVPCLEPRQREHRQAWLAGGAVLPQRPMHSHGASPVPGMWE